MAQNPRQESQVLDGVGSELGQRGTDGSSCCSARRGTSGLLARVEHYKDRSCGRGGTERCPCRRRLPGAGSARERRSQLMP